MCVIGRGVTPNFFSMLGTPPIVGRTLTYEPALTRAEIDSFATDGLELVTLETPPGTDNLPRWRAHRVSGTWSWDDLQPLPPLVRFDHA